MTISGETQLFSPRLPIKTRLKKARSSRFGSPDERKRKRMKLFIVGCAPFQSFKALLHVRLLSQ
jgi:hypothetical protein